MTASAPVNTELDRDDRDRARLRLDRNIVVEAGAGTGKTALLTDRVLFLILGAGISVTDIVALTFTEKAAGEIQVRLGDRLAHLIAHLDKTNFPNPHGGDQGEGLEALMGELKDNFRVDELVIRERARKALENMDKAMIGTLHSFAASLLRSYPLQAGVDPSFQVDEGDRFDELFPSEWARWLDVELAEDSPREKQWTALLSCVTLKELEVLARDLCGPRVNLDRLDMAPPGMIPWLRETVAILEAEPARQPKTHGGIADQIHEICDRLESLQKLSSPLVGEDQDEGKGAFGKNLTAASWPKGWDKTHYERYRAALRIAEKASPQGEALIAEAAELLSGFAVRFRGAFSWRGSISFDGLLIAARDLVRDHTDVRTELKKSIRAFLVDEFQDTDPLQGELLLYLSEMENGCAGRWEEVQLVPGKLFVVGDPKQSIYRFRGADLAAYEGFTRHMLDSKPPALFCELKTNFRSHAGILNPVNSTFHKLIRYAKHSQPEYKPIHARAELSQSLASGGEGDAQRGAVELVLIDSPGDKKKAGVEIFRRTEAEWIAAWVETHCLLDKAPISSQEGSGGGKCRLKDVAVLLRTTTPLEDYLDVFRERRIPYVVETEKYFYGTQEVQDFLNLLRALDDPSDRKSLAGLLRSPLVGLPDGVLYQLSEEGELDYRSDVSFGFDERDRVNGFYRALRSLHSGVGRRPLGDLVRSVLEETQVLEFLPAAYHGQQTLSNLMKFGRMAAAADSGGMTLREFIRKVSRSIAQSLDEGESPLADEHLDAVRIMTIHKAKGLEFPVIFVPNLSGKILRGRDQRPIRFDWGSDAAGISLGGMMSVAAAYLEMKEKKREEDETARLLYVACTRAKRRLILLGAKEGDASAFSALLNEAGIWPDGGAEIELRRVIAGSPLLHAVDNRRIPAESRKMISRQELGRIWKRRFARREELESLSAFVSPSRSPTTLSREETGKRAFYDDPESAKVSGNQVGRVCHKVLEYWDWKSPGDVRRAVSAACRSLAWEHPGQEWGGIASECEKLLKGFLKSEISKKLSGAEILGREIPFAYANGGQVVRGSMDLLYRLGGKLWVADYKTDAIKENELQGRAKRYKKQAEMYVEAVRRGLGVEEAGFELIFMRLGLSVEL